MIAILPVGMNYQTQRLPVVTFTLIGLNTLIYLVSLVCFFNTDGSSDLWIYEHLWLVPVQSSWCTWLTSLFVHEGFFHLLGNMIFLFLFGCCVEDIIGRARFAVLYLASGLVAEFTYIAFTRAHFQSEIPMGGASGAISACMGMYLLLRACAKIEFKYFIWLFLVFFRTGEFELPAWVAITFWFAKDLFWMIVGFYSEKQGGGTAFGAHVGGFLAGLALVAVYQRVSRGREPEEKEEANKRFIKPERIRVAARPRPVVSTTETPTIFLHDGTAQSGPFTLAQVEAMLHAGEITRETEYWSEGLDTWQNIADLSGQPGG